MDSSSHRTPWSTLERSIFAEGQSTPQDQFSDHAPVPGTRTVLVVDDDADMRLYVRDCLEPPFETTGAANAAEALRLMHAHPPALVISDVVMPGLDGYALCQRIRQDARLRDIPILLVSGEATDTLAEKAQRAGAAFLVKPFNRRALLDHVARLLPDDAPG